MRLISYSQCWLAALFLAGVLPAAAQLSSTPPDPLARIREAAKTNAPACSASGETLCEQIAPKIIALEQDDSPLAENVRGMVLQLSVPKLQIREEVVAWGVAAFRAAGLSVHTEQNPLPQAGADANSLAQDVVVAEIRGREKPGEWVLLGTQIDGHDPATARTASNAALLVEAARDIQLTGIRPRQSIRFVLLISGAPGNSGSWPYVYAHREAMKPIESLDAGHNNLDAAAGPASLDFILEGIPTISANQQEDKSPGNTSQLSEALAPSKIQELKRNTEVVAVTAFGIAELSEPLGLRQSRIEIQTLLKAIGLDEQMKKAGLWSAWESGQRGRMP